MSQYYIIIVQLTGCCNLLSIDNGLDRGSYTKARPEKLSEEIKQVKAQLLSWVRVRPE